MHEEASAGAPPAGQGGILLVAGHMAIHLTRNRSALWQRPWPSWKLVLPCEVTQLIGTLAA